MMREEIRVGETYRIRGWDDLVREYGTDNFGTTSVVFVKTQIPFPSTYRDRCGKQFTVRDKRHAIRESDPHYFDLLLSEEGVEVVEELPGKKRIIVITPEMLEPFEEAAFEEIATESLVDFLMN